jgi:hypothetical protein
LSFAWYFFYGRLLGMSKKEVEITRFGEMCDLIACYRIVKMGMEEDFILTDDEMIPDLD